MTPGNEGDATVAETLLKDVLEPTCESTTEQAQVYGDASYGSADLVEKLETLGVQVNTKVGAPPSRVGMFSQDDFVIDTKTGTVRCPGGVLVALRSRHDGSMLARFQPHCDDCPLRAQCTASKEGRSVRVHAKHAVLERARIRQRDPGWRARYRATRPKVERKIAHLMRRKHGGRRARVRGRLRVAHDFALLAAAVNLTRIARRPGG